MLCCPDARKAWIPEELRLCVSVIQTTALLWHCCGTVVAAAKLQIWKLSIASPYCWTLSYSRRVAPRDWPCTANAGWPCTL